MMKSTEEDYCHEEEALACPPMDDYALSDAFFYGNHQGSDINIDPSVFFADLSKQEDEGLYSPKKKQPLLTRYNGKGKEWHRVLQVLQPNLEMLAKVNTRLEPMRCRLAVKGVIVHKSACAQPVTKARKTVKIVVKKQVNVVMQSNSSMQNKNNLTATRRSDMSMPLNDNDFESKFEATKRKLRELYDRSNNLKKQRTTQLIDLQHLPPVKDTNKRSLNSKPKPKVSRTKTMTWN